MFGRLKPQESSEEAKDEEADCHPVNLVIVVMMMMMIMVMMNVMRIIMIKRMRRSIAILSTWRWWSL